MTTRLRIDPWDPEHGGSWETVAEPEEDGEVRLDVEDVPWEPRPGGQRLERGVFLAEGGVLPLEVARSARVVTTRVDTLQERLESEFGDVDHATLETAVEALERLRQTERMVGVISHVPTLGERIPAGLEVEIHPRGSRVRRR